MGSCLTDVLDSLATEPSFVPDDQVNNQVEYKARSINVWGADGDNQSIVIPDICRYKAVDDQSAVVADICSKLVPGDNVVVVGRVKTEPCFIDVLNDPSTESVSVPDDQVKQEERERPMMHVQ